MNSRRLLAGLYLFLLLAIGLGGGTLYLKMRQEFETQRRTHEKLAADLTALRAKVEKQERYLKRLREDPALVERLLRERLNYSKPGEWVFDFVE